MAGLDSEDLTGSFEVRLRGNVAGGTEVGSDADTFKDGGGCNEGGDIRDTKGVGAFLDGWGTSSCSKC